MAAAGIAVEDDQDLARPASARRCPQASVVLTPSVIDSNASLLVGAACSCLSEATGNDEQGGSDMRAAKRDLPFTAQSDDYTGVWAELGDMHY